MSTMQTILSLASIGMFALGCASDTGGARVTFDAEAVGTAPVTAGTIAYDDAETGWHVTLTTARVALGPVYLWSGKPLNTLRTANAEDQFDFGFLRGQVVDQVPVDLIASAGAPTPIGAGDGLAGEALSAELWLAPPVDSAVEWTFEVVGEATRAGTTVRFRGGLTIDESVIDETSGDTAFVKRKVRAIPFEAEVADGGTVVVACDARRWLAGADFAHYLPDPVPDPNVPIDAVIAFPDPVWNQWLYQVRQARGIGPWSLTWLDP